MAKLIVPGRLPGLNNLIEAERRNKYAGAKMKRDAEAVVRFAIRKQFRGFKPKPPVILRYRFFEPDRRRDKDNISGFAHKVIQDALVREGILKNDGWAYVEGFSDAFEVDSKHPRIELEVEECRSPILRK